MDTISDTVFTRNDGEGIRLPRWRVLSVRGQAFLNGEVILGLMLGFLLGRVSLVGMAPFGAVFWLLFLRERPRQSYLIAVAVIAGRASAGGWTSAGYLLMALFVLWLWEGMYLRLWAKKSPLFLSATFLCFIGSPLLSQGSLVSFNKILLGVEVLSGVLATLALLPAIRLLEQLPLIRDRPVVEPAEALAFLLLFTLAITGLGNISIGWVSVQFYTGKLLILLVAYLAGTAGGAAAGLIIGIILGLGSPHLYVIIGSLSFSGFCAGFMRQFGRLGCAAGFIFSFPLLTMLTPSAIPGGYGVENLAVMLTFLILPIHFFKWASVRLPKNVLRGKENGNPERRDFLVRRIQHLASLFSELSESFSQVAAGKQRPAQEEMAPLINDLIKRSCEPCLFQRRCWDKEFYRSYSMVMELLAQSEGEIKEYQLPSNFRNRCPNPAMLISSINRSKEVWQVNHYWVNRLKEGRDLVSCQLKGVSELMLEIAREARAELFTPSDEKPAPLLTVELGVAQQAGQGQQVCGDYYSFSEIGDNMQMIIISDGMGQGPRARVESQIAVGMLERMLEAGFNKEAVIRIVNSLLQLRTPDEVFTTVDLTMMDLTSGDVECVKIGAAPSYWKRGKTIKKIGTASLPLGILSDLEIELHKEKAVPGDLLLMVSDGVINKGDWLASFLSRCEHRHPQVMAERILDEVNRHKPDHDDDMTVVVCKFITLKKAVVKE